MGPRIDRWGGAVVCAMAVLVGASNAGAHGIQGHVHVTGWAIENLPPSDLRDFFSDPEVMNAALFGAAFTDSGYWPQGGELADKAHAYGEHTHWEPFVQDFVAWILEHDPPPWTSLESRKRVAFLMGCASHGLQDEVFDSLYLYQVKEHDHGGQDVADPGTDGFLALDGHIRFAPEVWMPMDTLLELYSGLDREITADVIEDAVGVMGLFYLGEDAEEVALGLGERHRDALPWTEDHYLDPAIPGSLRAEIAPTMAYMEALWARLHGTFEHEDLVIHAYPEPPRRLHGRDAGSPDSWVTLVTGVGIEAGTATVTWTDEGGADVAFTKKGSRWRGLGFWGRLIRLVPSEDPQPGAWYTVGLEPGASLVDGGTLDASWSFDFQAPCEEPDAEACPDLGHLPIPRIDPPAEPEPEPSPELQPESGPEPTPDAGPEPQPEPSPEPVSDAGPEPDAAEPPAVTTDPGEGCAGGPGGGVAALVAALALLAAADGRTRSRRPTGIR
ncbi:MAG: hypothetical protein ACQEXJ_06205 [Myxococcota bacterium]